MGGILFRVKYTMVADLCPSLTMRSLQYLWAATAVSSGVKECSTSVTWAKAATAASPVI